jgi:hypothetical protein
MNTPRLALHLAAAAWVAAAGPVHADVSHALTGTRGSMALHADPLSSTTMRRADPAPASAGHESISAGAPSIDHLKSDRGALQMNRTFGALRPTGYGRFSASDPSGGAIGAATLHGVLDLELAQLRNGIERVRPLPQLLLGNRTRL